VNDVIWLYRSPDGKTIFSHGRWSYSEITNGSWTETLYYPQEQVNALAEAACRIQNYAYHAVKAFSSGSAKLDMTLFPHHIETVTEALAALDIEFTDGMAEYVG
jgi:hypothetical protein